jgi:hypothetical protein
MKKICCAVLLSVLGFTVFPSQGEVAYAAGGAAPATDPVQHCLDLVQLNLARKIAPASCAGRRGIVAKTACLADYRYILATGRRNRWETGSIHRLRTFPVSDSPCAVNWKEYSHEEGRSSDGCGASSPEHRWVRAVHGQG